MVAGTTGWPSIWFGNRLLMRNLPLEELQWVERGSSASSMQSRPAQSKFVSMGNGHSFSVPASRREEASGYLCLGEWKGLSLLCKNGLKKKMQEVWTCYSSKLELPLSWQFCSSRAGWLLSLVLLLTCVSKFSFLQFSPSSLLGMALIGLDARIYFYVELENMNIFFKI